MKVALEQRKNIVKGYIDWKMTGPKYLIQPYNLRALTIVRQLNICLPVLWQCFAYTSIEETKDSRAPSV